MRYELQTERLRLRPLRHADAERIVFICADRNVARMTARIPHPYTPQDAEAFLSYLALDDASSEIVFGIETAEDGLIGNIGLTKVEQGVYELGYVFGTQWHGKGFATEAGRAVLQAAFDDGTTTRLVAGHYVDNPASGRVLWKLGFRPTGEMIRHRALARNGYALANRFVLHRNDRRGVEALAVAC